MRYYQALTDGRIATGPIRVTFLWNGYPYIAYRDLEHAPAFSLRANEINFELDYGKLIQISEDEALHLDPDLFGSIWQNYQAFLEQEASHRKISLKKSA